MYEYKCEIVKIVDGDTIDVNIDLGFGTWIHNERIRLNGIDTPESRTRDLEEKKAGLYAKKCVEGFMPVGSSQVLMTKKDKSGKFGRVLGDFIIYDGQEDRNMGIVEYMIKHNIGVEYNGQSKQQIQEHHLQNRQYLKSQGVID
tara:strand:+ start:590 stop:1021 length:432 start_codon:yes stop_codon:yes gene_type:complete